TKSKKAPLPSAPIVHPGTSKSYNLRTRSQNPPYFIYLFITPIECIFQHLNLMFGSSRIASSAYQKWPTRDSHSPTHHSIQEATAAPEVHHLMAVFQMTDPTTPAQDHHHHIWMN
ncbi:hypothetical protein PPACK8108_LOCUS5271, partial [Phakopsora pachyrhizi]